MNRASHILSATLIISVSRAQNLFTSSGHRRRTHNPSPRKENQTVPLWQCTVTHVIILFAFTCRLSPHRAMPQLRRWVAPQACLLFMVCVLSSASAESAERTYIEDTDRFPGWKGELPHIIRPEEPSNTIGYGEGGLVRDVLSFPITGPRIM